LLISGNTNVAECLHRMKCYGMFALNSPRICGWWVRFLDCYFTRH
jgi:hypothetical protein